jgi:flagellar motor protein MotB
MIEEKNPFNEPAPEADSGPGNVKPGWIAAGLLAALLIAVSWNLFVVSGNWTIAKGRLNIANSALTNALTEKQQAKDLITALQTRVAELEKDKEEASQKAKGLEDEMRSDLESKDVTISKLQGKLTVNILDRVMFDSGEAIMKPDGEAVLRKVAAILTEHPELKIHVIGHTDNIPIRAKFASNWELSAARALAAVHFLTEKAGVDPHRVGAVGYGEYRPVADNSTEEGRARNRRIAITILSDELAGADTAPAVNTNAPTNPQPQSVAPAAP